MATSRPISRDMKHPASACWRGQFRQANKKKINALAFQAISVSIAAGAFASPSAYSAVAVGFTLEAGFIHEKADAPPIGFADRGSGGAAFLASR